MTGLEWLILAVLVGFAVWSVHHADQAVHASPEPCRCGYLMRTLTDGTEEYDGDCRSFGCDPECRVCSLQDAD